MVAPSASRNILAYATGRMAVQQEGYTYGEQKTSVKDAPVGAISSSSTNSSTSGQEKSSNNTIQLNAQEKKGVYTWSNKHGTNPVLTFKLDVNNVVHIKNPTDSKHQLIITSSGSQAASSGDVNPGSTRSVIIQSDNSRNISVPLSISSHYHERNNKDFSLILFLLQLGLIEL